MRFPGSVWTEDYAKCALRSVYLGKKTTQVFFMPRHIDGQIADSLERCEASFEAKECAQGAMIIGHLKHSLCCGERSQVYLRSPHRIPGHACRCTFVRR